MKIDDPWNTAGVAGLPAHDAGPERVARIRARCVTALAARQPAGRIPRTRVVRPGWLEPLVALGGCAAYLAAVTATCASLGVLRSLF